MARTKNNYVVGEVIQARVTLDEYCRHLTVKLEGEALAKQIARDTENRRKNGQDETLVDKKERFETTFRDVQPMKKGETPTEAETGLFSKVFKNKDDVLSLYAKKSNCPRFYVKTGEKTLREVKLEGKPLKSGQVATAVWKVYETSTSYGPQIGFEGLIFDEEPELWTPGPQEFGGYTIVKSDEAEPAAATETKPEPETKPESEEKAETKKLAFSW